MHLRALTRLFPGVRFIVVDARADYFLEHPEHRPPEVAEIEVRTFDGSVGTPQQRPRRLLIVDVWRRFEHVEPGSAAEISENLRLYNKWCTELGVAAALIPFRVPPTDLIRFHDLPVYAPRFDRNAERGGEAGGPERRMAWTPGIHAERLYGPNMRFIAPHAVERCCAACTRLDELLKLLKFNEHDSPDPNSLLTH